MTEIQNDPERLLHPQRRRPDGSFERISWPTALDEIGERLGAIRSEHGGESIGWYMGNPGAFSYSHPLWVKGFVDALGSQHYYTASSQDVSNRFAASSLLYGSPYVLPIPDLARTDLLLVVGANPLVSHGSVMSAPGSRTSCTRSSSGAAAWSSSIPVAPRPPASSSTCRCDRTPTPSSCSRSCT